MSTNKRRKPPTGLLEFNFDVSFKEKEGTIAVIATDSQAKVICMCCKLLMVYSPIVDEAWALSLTINLTRIMQIHFLLIEGYFQSMINEILEASNQTP